MKLTRLTVQFLPFILFSWNLVSAQQTIPFDDKRWHIQSRGHVIEPYQGYQSIYLQGGEAELRSERFLNGTIEFDVWLTPRQSFTGFFFRRTSPGNHEEIYFRSHQSGNPDAFQYTPVFNNDPAWQLYHDAHDGINDGFISWKPRGKSMGYNGVLKYSFDKWMHVKLVVNGRQAELFLNGSEQPAAFISQLEQANTAGTIGISASGGAAWYANFKVTHSAAPEIKTKEINTVATPPGTITKWEASNAFREDEVKNMLVLDNKLLGRLAWIPISVESSGLINLARISAVSDSTNTVFARFNISAEKDQVKKLEIGYSDRIRVYCNGEILYSGNTGFRSRDYRYLGTIGYFDAVYLPLKEGMNTITVAVSENFGGWGVMAKMPE